MTSDREPVVRGRCHRSLPSLTLPDGSGWHSIAPNRYWFAGVPNYRDALTVRRVDRSSPWGNPYKVEQVHDSEDGDAQWATTDASGEWHGVHQSEAAAVAMAVALHATRCAHTYERLTPLLDAAVRAALG